MKFTIPIIVAATLLMTACNPKKTKTTEAGTLTDSLSIETVQEPEMAWGYYKDSIRIDSSIVKRNQSLSDILRPLGISASTVHFVAQNSKDVFDIRHIRAGNDYYLLYEDTIKTPTHLIYKVDAVEYVDFSLNNSLQVLLGEKEVEVQTRSVSGIIESSLWNAMVNAGTTPALALELSDIFAWTVDFFDIQANDKFKVIYKVNFVDGEFVGLHSVESVCLEHKGVEHYAFAYEGNEQHGYFDEDGNSLRKTFLKAPLNFSRISSRFSNSRMHPVLKYRRPHHGVDYAAPSGTPVVSIGDGVITKKGYQARGGGNHLSIKHNSVYTTKYMHLKGFAKGIKAGARVKQGQLIGYVGSTGLSTGPHLDFRVYKNGSPIDPLKMEAPPAEPISETNKTEFMVVKDSLSTILQGMDYHTAPTQLAQK